ncbi:DUF763 domain-containing protein [Candidatus Peregrinibacteria bacterium]|nr:DUF763 domain-containing protein [Candidatus Peregrinibacteria bacterium]MBI5732874.1 DUF763 domain-containing protein [Candidatus Jorgensenbacteria bacterium]
MIQRGIATFTLDEGRCPRWLFERMVKLGREIIRALVAELGPERFIERIGDPVWFQSLGTVLAFDWNASGLTTILTAALKEAIRGEEQDLGIFICGGKGKTSRKTPDEINQWSERLSLPPEKSQALVYNSRISAKVDSALLQDGYQIYHHAFFFTKSGAWTVVQQGMNIETETARRYHWYSERLEDMVCEPHTGIVSPVKHARVLDLTARNSHQARTVSTDLVSQSHGVLFKDLQLLSRHRTPISATARFSTSEGPLTLLHLKGTEFYYHPMVRENFSESRYLQKILTKLCDEKPKSYETLLATPGVGPKTIRALALVAEIIYGARVSYEDPARYSFAHGGKDATPYPVDRPTYDRTIEIMKRVGARAKRKLSP